MGHTRKNIRYCSNENTFVELLHDHFLEQPNTAPTRGSDTLDLVLTNFPNKVKICDVLSPAQAELFTDHHVIEVPKVHRKVYNYRQGDFVDSRT